MRLILFLAGGLLLVHSWAASAQGVRDRPVGGVVWQQPDLPHHARIDLLRMGESGIQAVRTGPVHTSDLLELADTLGLQLFQELPVQRLPARRLRDTLAFSQRMLNQVLRASAGHPSARTFGLAWASDTSDSTACAYFASLAELVRRTVGSSARVYYVTPFIENDVCSHTVDFVLIDALLRQDPSSLLRRWHAAHPDVPAGIASIGQYVRSDERHGLRVEGSPESQARYLERTLRRIYQEGHPATAVFVYRWRDLQPLVPSPAFDLENPYRHAFGLLSANGNARPSLNVVAGVFGRGQDVFAFPAGRDAPDGYPLTTLAGWLVFIVLGVAFASSPRLRPMVPRYFTAHGFYREAVREGRDVLLTASIVLLVALALAVAVIWFVVLDALRTSPDFLLLFRMLPIGLQEFLVTILSRPILFLLLVGSVYGVSLTVWSAMLAFASRRRYPLAPAQALMLAIWPRWTVLVLLLGAMVLATLPETWTFMGASILLAAWVGVTLLATGRTLYDYASVTRVPGLQLVAGALLNPLVLMLFALLILAIRWGPESAFLWHALLRS